MALSLSGLSDLGLEHLEDIDIFETPKEEKAAERKTADAPAKPAFTEKDYVYDKKMECPVCHGAFSSKVVKTGKSKLLEIERDLRPRYQGIDITKYDVVLCTKCGYSALSRFFSHVTAGQVKAIRENICQKVRLKPYDGAIYTYEEATERYKLALATAMVKRAKVSEKAYICLRAAWMLRGYSEFLRESGEAQEERLQAIAAREEEYLSNAYEGFAEARRTEPMPICGMDENTVDYLLAVLALRFEKYSEAGRYVAGVLTSVSANSRTKDRARELKEEIMAGIKRQGIQNAQEQQG